MVGLNILLICQEPIHEKMAGPAIRYWELAHALAATHRVTLLAAAISRTSETVTLVSGSIHANAARIKAADVLVSQQLHPRVIVQARRHGTALVMDAYDPLVLENLHTTGHPRGQRAHLATIGALTNIGLLAADVIVCASERQRDLWLGSLMSLGRLTQEESARDVSLRALVAVVPFGVQHSTAERRVGVGARAEFDLADDAVIALWGGGIWDWLDPVTVIEGLAIARKNDPRINLVFMGTRHPVAAVSADGSAYSDAIAAAIRLQLLNNGVYFREGWVAYDDRQAYLMDADIGVSAHRDHAETRFSFRTRVLDYLWSGLPSILTVGDSMTDLAISKGFGIGVPEGDAAAWGAALLSLSDSSTLRAEMSHAAKRVAEEFTWPHIAEALGHSLAAAVDRDKHPAVGIRLMTESLRLVVGATTSSAYQGRIRRLFTRR